MLVLQDWLFFWGHTALVIFNLLGWIWRRTRVLHLMTLGLTSFSWFALGAIYGWGYCFCTDYHAHVLRQMDHPDANLTFIQLMFKRLAGVSLPRSTADTVALSGLGFAIIATATVWTRQWYRRRQSERRERVGPANEETGSGGGSPESLSDSIQG